MSKTIKPPRPNTRQEAVYRLALRGMDVTQIGKALDMRLVTVRQHLHMLRKMGALAPTQMGRPKSIKGTQATSGAPWTPELDEIVLWALDNIPADGRVTWLSERMPERSTSGILARILKLRPREVAAPGAMKPWPEWHRFDSNGRDLKMKPTGCQPLEFKGLPAPDSMRALP